MKANNPIDKVRRLQRKLFAAAKCNRQRRFHALYDRIYRPDILWRAWEEVRANGGAAGIDGVTIADVEAVDVGELLEEDRLAFHHRLRGERADVAEAEDGGAVGDDADEVAARGVARGELMVFGESGDWLGRIRVTAIPGGSPRSLKLPALDRVEVTVPGGAAPASQPDSFLFFTMTSLSTQITSR